MLQPFDIVELELTAHRTGRGELVMVDMEQVLELTAIAKKFNAQTEEMKRLKAEIREQEEHIENLERELGWAKDVTDFSS